jgi:hypothetical protein
MNNLERLKKNDIEKDDAGEEPSKGPNLVLLYSLIALALVVAIGFAALIVLPFYRAR